MRTGTEALIASGSEVTQWSLKKKSKNSMELLCVMFLIKIQSCNNDGVFK